MSAFLQQILISALAFVLIESSACAANPPSQAPPSEKEITRDALLDHTYGGWAGMLIGGIEGLPHEFKYREQPRESLPDFTFLAEGARSDDDNDFPWL